MPSYGRVLSDEEIQRRVRNGEVVRFRVTDRRELLPQIPDVLGASSDYDKRTERGITGRECAVCGKQAYRKGRKGPVLHVRVSQAGSLHAVPVSAELPEDDDMGCFPVDAECAKRFPASHLTELSVGA